MNSLLSSLRSRKLLLFGLLLDKSFYFFILRLFCLSYCFKVELKLQARQFIQESSLVLKASGKILILSSSEQFMPLLNLRCSFWPLDGPVVIIIFLPFLFTYTCLQYSKFLLYKIEEHALFLWSRDFKRFFSPPKTLSVWRPVRQSKPIPDWTQ